MGVLSALLTLPVAGPIKGSTWVMRKIHDAVEADLNDPAAIRRELDRLEAALLAGALSEDDYDAAELVLLRRLQAARS
ncbi:MAG: gas vesicle protein GvpG [Pseudomonadota bacterium]